MALNLKYKDDNGILQIKMNTSEDDPPPTITSPRFDTINNRFSQYDLFGAKYQSGDSPRSLFSSRYNSVEEELANTPYAFSTDRLHSLNISISSPSKDIEDDRFFNRNIDLFGPSLDETPAFTVTQLIHAQDRYFDLNSESVSGVTDVTTVTVDREDDAFTVLTKVKVSPAANSPVISISKKKKESSFAIITETPVASRPSSPRSLPVDIRSGRVSPFKGRGFREETSRHTTPKTSAANSRANSPPRRRTHSLSRIDKMAQTATLPPPIHFNRPHSPRDFVRENIDEVRGLSELNREKHEAEAEQKRIEEEEAILKEMGLMDKNGNRSKSCSRTNSRANSRSNSPGKIKLRSRSNSPSAIVHFENISENNNKIFNKDDGMPKQATHRSRVRSVSKSQPQSNEGSPKHSKIPKRQSSVSPTRKDTKRESSSSRKPVENGLSKNQKFMSNSTSSIHESIRIGSQVHDKRGMSKSTQLLHISPAHIRGKPPISPGRGGPPPSNRAINPKRLSPIVGTPNKSPTEDKKPSSAKTSPKPSPVARKPVKTAGNTPSTSRLTSRQPSRAVSRDPSPEKRRNHTKPTTNTTTLRPGTKSTPSKPVSRSVSTKVTPKPSASKTEPKKPITRTSSVKSLTRASSTKTLNDKPPIKKKDSKRDLTMKSESTNKINEVGAKQDNKDEKSPQKTRQDLKSETSKDNKIGKKDETKQEVTKTSESSTVGEEVMTQDNETQYDTITNEKGELVILTKKNIVSMTTAAITSQPLEVVTTVTNQLPAAFEKAREKGIFERINSRDSIAPGDDEKDTAVSEDKKVTKTKNTNEKVSMFGEDNVKLKPLQPPYNNPQVERVKQKIDSILKDQPEVSPENILASAKKETKTFKSIADKAKSDIKEAKNEPSTKISDLKDQVVKLNEKTAAEAKSEATKIVDSIMTPVEEPKIVEEKVKEVIKKDIEPIITVVNEKKKNGNSHEKMTETLVKGEADVEVQSSNLSSPGGNKMAVQNKMADGNGSDKSSQSNGGFPTSTSTTPKPPSRAHRQPKEDPPNEPKPEEKPPNICQRLMGKCKSSCPCIKGEEEEKKSIVEEKKGFMNKFSCCKKKEDEERMKEIERAAGKASIEFENETKHKRKFRDVICCKRQRRVSDVSHVMPRHVTEALAPGAVGDTGCCGKRRQEIERRDSILSDRPPNTCCNNRLCLWIRGACRRHSDLSTSSRRPSMFSKNKSLSPTLPPEDTRKKLDPSLVEHTSMMRGAIPVLPIFLAYLCLLCNVVVPGLGTILSGMFCLCFGIPRFGVHDGAKHRIGSLVINLLTGCGQLFTVLFCLVGWGWSVWWGVIMLNLARKYRKLKAEAAANESEAPPVTTNNHTRA